MLKLSIAVLVALTASTSAAPQAISSAATTGNVTAISNIGKSTSDVYPPAGSKFNCPDLVMSRH